MRAGVFLSALVAAGPALAEVAPLSFVTEAERLDLPSEAIRLAEMRFDQNARPVVSFVLNARAGRDFARLTANAVGQVMGVYVCGELVTEPMIASAIHGGQGQLSAQTVAEAEAFVAVLAGAQDCPVKDDGAGKP